jgi:hypothetical protein
VPFGFLPDRITHHPQQAPAIRRAYADVLSGATLAGVARRWNADGLQSGRVVTGAIRTGKPSQWNSTTVRAVLLKPRNAGLRAYRGATFPGAWLPIVPVETWLAAVALLTQTGRRGAPPAAKYLLSGVGVCGVCGGPVNAGVRRPKYHAYRCRSHLGHVARRGDDVDHFITDLVIGRLAQPDAVTLLAERHPEVDVIGLRGQGSALRSRIELVAVEFADDPAMTPAQFRVMNRRLHEQLAAVELQLAEVGRVDVLTPLVGVDDVQRAWQQLTVDQQRAVIDTLMFVVLHPVGRGARVFNPDSIQIIWKTGPSSG